MLTILVISISFIAKIIYLCPCII